MKIQFDASQEYQLDAIRAITDLFDGQPLKQGDSEISFGQEAQAGMFLSEQGLAKPIAVGRRSNSQKLASHSGSQWPWAFPGSGTA